MTGPRRSAHVGLASLVLASLVFCAAASAAAAEATNGPPSTQPALEFGAGLTGVLGSGRFTHGDQSGSSGSLYTGVAVAPRYRWLPQLTTGLTGVAALTLGRDGTGGSDGTVTYDRRLYRAALDVRFWPWPDATVSPFVGAEVGALALQTLITVTGTTPQDLEPAGTEVAATFGGRAGAELVLSTHFQLGAEIALLRAGFDPPSTPYAEGRYYDPLWWSVALGVTYVVGE